jgi:transposase-like protein
MKPDLSSWVPQAEAAERLGVSEKTLVRWAQDKKLQRGDRPREGKKPEPVYHPSDVERLEAERAAPFIACGSTEPAGLARIPQTNGVVAHLVAVIAQALERVSPPTYRGPWMTLKQASVHSGLSRALLRRAIDTGSLPFIRDRALKVRACDVDNLDYETLVHIKEAR